MSGNFTYASTIDAITDLYAEYTYVEDSNLPILVVMHGYGSAANAIDATTRARLAAYGLFVVSVGMRGRNAAEGTQDSGRRELHDIYDVLAHVRTAFPLRVHATLAGIAGYSGGGGNVLGCACKFPDAFSVYADYFGMSDYGHDAETAWPSTNTTWMGGDPATVPDNYFSNYHLGAITNLTGGHLWLFHDEDDSTVEIEQSQNIGAALLAAERTNYTENYTNASNAHRWTHGLPSDVADLQHSEPLWCAPLTTATAWTIPESGALKVAGYLVTKRFTLFLGTGDAEYGSVTYNMATRAFTITAETGAATWTLTLHGQTPETSIAATINTVEGTETSDANGNVTFTGSIA